MAEPRSYSILRVPKPSLYLHYWIDNAPNSVINSAIGTLSQYKNVILQEQLARFRAIQASKISSLNTQGAGTIDQIGELFDASIYQENMDQYLEAHDIEGIDQVENYDITSFEDAMQKLESLESSDSIVSRLSEFQEAVYQLLDAFDPIKNKEVVSAMQDRFLRELAKDAAISKAKAVPAQLTEAQKSRCAEQIIRDVLMKNEGKVYNVNTLNDNESLLTNMYKKLLMIASALDNFESGSIKSSGVRHGKNKKISNTAHGDNEVLQELAGKIQGMGRYLKYNASEYAAAVAVIEPSIEGVFKPLINSDINKPKVIGDKYFQIKKDVSDNAVYKQMIESASSKIANIKKQKSKADVHFNVTTKGVTAEVGFSVKTGKMFEPGMKGNSGHIKLQDETSLLRLLAREAGLSELQLYSILQLLVGHSGSGVDSLLDSQWNQMKEKILYMAALDVLAGGTIEGFSDFMITNNGVVSIGSLLEEMIQDESILSLSMKNVNTSGGSLERKDYVQLNTWEGIATPQDDEAIVRSDKLWSEASELLYQTKIRIMLNISDLARFKSL